MTTKFFEQLSSNLNELFKNNEEYNVIIEVGQEPNIHTFKVHSNILSSRCLYFKDKLAAITYNDNNMKVIKQANVSIEVFDIIIKYIYNGIISLETVDASVIFELLIASSEFGLAELIKQIQLFLIENHTSWLRLNFSLIYQAVLKSNNLKDLQQFYENIIDKHPNIIFDSDDFPALSENILIYILKLDNLQMNEGKIWDYVIKWGIARNPSLPPKLDQWSEVHFLALKNSLQNCLPLIRYFQTSGEDIFDKVRPYRKILEPTLWEDIMLKFMAPNRNITSNVLPPRINITIVDNSTSEIESKLGTRSIMGRNDESFVDLMEIEPNVASALNNSGITYLKMKKFNESFTDLNKLLEIEPDEAFALRIRGVTYRIEESHLFLSIKIVSPDIFECHQGFDLANFDNPQYPLSEVLQFKILKNETYGAFKAMVAQKFGILSDQIRFWNFIKRPNETIRPEIPIVDNFLTMTMENFHKKYARIQDEQDELKLFLNVMDKPFNTQAWFPQDSFIMISVKYFNPDSQSLKGLCHLYIKGFNKVGDIIPILCKAKGFPPHTPVKIYEEIKPNMIVMMNPKHSFDQSEIQNGDIICFQKALTEEESLNALLLFLSMDPLKLWLQQ
ncbi:ICP0-binding domain of ubiquitin-specific protease 7-domain-containing protein [Gigaspora rosea]|uniref:ICP0-binding domain of ubiquitin-specific protease 7-domain-containing protein n=1 Tax=Gigaspora rosea TaxID=44941 RepID=A0A397URD6_9GLOM|nr:ICP0-binding domain of ubiquitin-specific protease 7-domain-containing protein [Gigaspora rosea]